MENKILTWIKATLTKVKKPAIYVGLFLCVLLIAFLAGKCSTKKERDVINSNLMASRDSVSHSKAIIKGLEYSVTTMNALVLTKDDALKTQILENERLKALHISELVSNAELQGVIQRQDSLLSLPPKTEYLTIRDSVGIRKHYIRFPIDLLNIHDPYLSLNVGIDSIGKAWYKNIVPVSGELSVGYIGTGFLRLKQKPVGVFTSQNPHLTITDMDVLIIRENKKWFQKWWVHALEGALIVEGGRILLK
jgi:hypothetical protein